MSVLPSQWSGMSKDNRQPPFLYRQRWFFQPTPAEMNVMFQIDYLFPI